jgi:hypothetical protein
MVPGIMHLAKASDKPCGTRRGCCIAALMLQCGMLLGGCGAGAGPFAALELPETEAPAGDWPRLVEVPDYAGPGATPAPATGRRIAEALTREAAAAAVAAQALGGPVVEAGSAAALATGRAGGR